jgi:pimeloyl-ACP methyl ester carboxylesterase
VDRLRHLVVVIPGIGGSVLESPAGEPVHGQGRSQLVQAVVDPSRLDLYEQPDLRPVELLSSVTVFPPLVLHGYDGLVRQLRSTFADVRVDICRPDRDPDLSADVVLFPYDFRLSIRDAARRLADTVRARLAPLTGSARQRRVIVVAHSMGGLVARYWLGPLGGARLCRALVTVGTPHRGAPKALDWLVNGAEVRSIRLKRATEVLRQWPSAYELLPRYPAVLDEVAKSARYPHELTGVGGESFPARAKCAYGVHLDIERAWTELAVGDPKSRPEIVAMFARGHATLNRATIHNGRLTVTRKADPEWLPNPGWRGDGTVPAISAIPIEMDDQRAAWQAVVERHGPMATSPMIIEVLRTLSGGSLAAARGDHPDRPWFGLDLDECIPVGEPLLVGAQLYGVDAETAADRVAVWLTVRPLDVNPPWRRKYPMPGEASGWSVQADPLPAGRYALTVEAVNVPGIGRVASMEAVAVIES